MTTSEIRRCKCRCGSEVKNNYRAGHDQRHVGQMVQAFVTKMDAVRDYERSTLYKNCIDQLPTEALKGKFRKRIAELARRRYQNAIQSLRMEETVENAWFNRSLVGLLTQYPDPTYTETDRALTRALLAATGWDRRSVGTRLS